MQLTYKIKNCQFIVDSIINSNVLDEKDLHLENNILINKKTTIVDKQLVWK